MLNLQQIYQSLPVSLQNGACTLMGWQLQRANCGPEFLRRLRIAEERFTWSHEQVIAFRDQRLRAFVRHAVESVPFYRNLLQDHGLSVDGIRGIGDLEGLPTLSKAAVRENHLDLSSPRIPPAQKVLIRTSGTTGGGLRFASTRDAVREQWALWWGFRRSHGIELGTWCGYFAGWPIVHPAQTSPPFWRSNAAGRQILFSAYHLSADTASDYVAELRRCQPRWLHGYPSLLALLASFMLEQGLELGYIPTWITTGSETLLPQQAKLITAAFGARPLQHYGMVEAVANFSECTRGKLHVDETFAAVEFLPVPGSSLQRVVGTNLTNPATPLLRYDVGDLVELEPQGCGCGRPGRVVRRVHGRQEDYIVLRNGARVGNLDEIFKDLTTVREAQIFQDAPGRFVLRVATTDTFTSSDEAQLVRELHCRIGDQADVRIQYVDRVERSPRGKLRFVISALPDGRLAAA